MDAASLRAKTQEAYRQGPDAVVALVAGLLAEGLANTEIAERLAISAKTVESHIAHAANKAGVSGRLQLALKATARGEAAPDAS